MLAQRSVRFGIVFGRRNQTRGFVTVSEQFDPYNAATDFSVHTGSRPSVIPIRMYALPMRSIAILKRSLLFISVFVLLLAGTLSVRAADRMAAGQWEFTLTGNGESRTMKQCMTPDQANEMNGDTKTARGFAEKRAKGRCTIKSYDIQGNTVKYSLVCGDRTIDSSTTFTGDTSEGTLTTTTADGNVDVKTVKARRLGACP
jgi:hypothetical protein